MLFGLFAIMPFAACLFWMTVLLLDWRRDNPAQHVLSLFMGVSATLYLCHAAFFYHESSVETAGECLYAFCNIAVFPLYYLYICRLTESKGLSWRSLAIFIPTLIIGLWATILNICCPHNVAAENLRILVMRIVFMLQLVPICWSGYRKLKTFDNEISNYYSETSTRDVHPTIRMMALLVGGALISGLANFFGRDYFDSADLLICIPSVLFTILLFGVGYVGKRQEFCIDDLLRDEKNYADSSDTEEQSDIISSLDKLMEEQKLYLNPDLRLPEVATLLGVGRTTLSQRINQELRVSFSSYINRLRIEYACKLLSDPKGNKMSLTGVAELSGFSSDSSFYRAFRQHTGKTPKQFIEN